MLNKESVASLVNNDIIDIGLNLTTSQIKGTTKHKLKKILSEKINYSAFLYLEDIKERHSKVKNIQYTKLEMAKYLKDSKISTDIKQLIFRLRTRMINVKANFGTMFGDTSCDLCEFNVPQTQRHLLGCSAIVNSCSELQRSSDILYSDLFSGVEKQEKCAQLYSIIIQTKETLDEEKISDANGT